MVIYLYYTVVDMEMILYSDNISIVGIYHNWVQDSFGVTMYLFDRESLYDKINLCVCVCVNHSPECAI